MSTQFQIVKQKALERLGQVVVTNDAIYSSMFSNISLLSQTVTSLIDRIKSLLKQYQEICTTSSDIARAFNGLYEGSNRYFATASSINVKQRGELRDEFIPKLCTETEQKIVHELENWTSDVDNLRSRMQIREEMRVRFDHYMRKIQTIRESRDKYASRNRPFPFKERSKLERNERKLEESRREFQTLNEECIKEMHSMWAQRFEGLDQALLNSVQGEHLLAQQLYSCVKECLSPIQAAHDKHCLQHDNQNLIQSVEGREIAHTKQMCIEGNSGEVKAIKQTSHDTAISSITHDDTISMFASEENAQMDPFSNPSWNSSLATSHSQYRSMNSWPNEHAAQTMPSAHDPFAQLQQQFAARSKSQSSFSQTSQQQASMYGAPRDARIEVLDDWPTTSTTPTNINNKFQH